MRKIKLFEQFVYSSLVNENIDAKTLEELAKKGQWTKRDNSLSKTKEQIPQGFKELTEVYVKGLVGGQKFNADGQFKDLVDLIDDIQDNKETGWNTGQILNLLDSIKMGYVKWSKGGGGYYPAIRVLQDFYYLDEDRNLSMEVMGSNAPWNETKKAIDQKVKECYNLWLGGAKTVAGSLPDLKGEAQKIFKSLEDQSGLPQDYKNRKSPSWNVDFLKRGSIKGHMRNPEVRLDAFKVYGQLSGTMTEEQLGESIKATQKYLGVPQTGKMDQQTWEKWVKSISATTINEVFQKFGDLDLIFDESEIKNPPAQKLKKAIEKLQGYAKEYFYDKMLVDGKIGSQTLTAIIFLHISYLKATGKLK